ncbi:DUF2384 domain-containing protein [Maribrevibacterium harenarium]|uniref:DUF2384 domain-containing protein n=1 Tax=Maribrevibacterium harenarium TaxID=2589817 RepID=A0A501WHM8_9GAMM|nr:MbcA/ParS/Xre antitoxin family protein [Maribrevibacterium harenarium]TPE46591.1 DUF2384 domain-containing protein [Maribrevibacterium harenarium]
MSHSKDDSSPIEGIEYPINSEDELLELANQIFANKQKAELWLNKPALALGGATPMEFAKTPEGKTAVIDLLGKIRHGIFA